MRLDTLKKTCQDVRKALLEEKKKKLSNRGTRYYCYSAYHCLEELEKPGENVHFFLHSTQFPVAVI